MPAGMKTTYDRLAIEHAPWMAPLANCPGAEVQANGDILVDTENECLKELRATRYALPKVLNPATAGMHLARILTALGVKNIGGGCRSCAALALQMDAYGNEWCMMHRDRIVERLRRMMDQLNPREVVAAIGRAVAKGMTFIDPKDVPGSIFDEAVRRSSR